MTAARPGTRWLWMGGGAALALGVALWWQLSENARTPPVPRPAPATGAEQTTETPASRPIPEAGGGARTGLPHIAASGRLAIRSQDLPRGEALVLSLGLPDEAIAGGEPRPARVVAVDGRTLDTTATPAPPDAGDGSAVQLEIDPQWLRPGRYMIEVKTAEKSHFPLRRYVLEVR